MAEYGIAGSHVLIGVLAWKAAVSVRKLKRGGIIIPLFTQRSQAETWLPCGKSGIQTHGTARPYAGFRVRSIRSLWHLSGRKSTQFLDAHQYALDKNYNSCIIWLASSVLSGRIITRENSDEESEKAYMYSTDIPAVESFSIASAIAPGLLAHSR